MFTSNILGAQAPSAATAARRTRLGNTLVRYQAGDFHAVAAGEFIGQFGRDVGSLYRIQHVAEQRRFEPDPAARDRFDRTDGDPNGLHTVCRIDIHREADDGDRVVARLAQRQARMRGLARVPRHDDPREQPAGCECRSHPEEAFQTDPLTIVSAGNFDLGVEAEQRRHTIRRGERRRPEVAPDRRHRADRRVGGAAGGRCEHAELGRPAKAAANAACVTAAPISIVSAPIRTALSSGIFPIAT